jgi:prepilin-type N-terminal cleavage/methylation domain-containing protein
MKKISKANAGFTLFELMIALAILSVVVVVLAPRIELLKARSRYSRVAADVRSLVTVANADFADNHDYAPPAFPGELPPRFQNWLGVWPQPPCPGWNYQWDNIVDANLTGFVRITVRNASDAPLFYQCVSVVGGLASCEETGDPIYGGQDLFNIPDKVVSCEGA